MGKFDFIEISRESGRRADINDVGENFKKIEEMALTTDDLPSMDFVPLTQKGVANGVATLDGTGKIPGGQLPDMNYIPTTQKGTAGGVATLDTGGKVPTGQLPDMNYDPAGSSAAVQDNLNTHVGNNVARSEGVHGFRFFADVLQYHNGTEWVDISTGGMTPPENVSNLSLTPGNSQITIRWSDPNDTVLPGLGKIEWQSTRVVRKVGGYPTDVNDGTTLVTNTVRNQYASTGLTDTGLAAGTTYYYKLFPVSVRGAINTDSRNNISGSPQRITIPTVPSQSGALTYTGALLSPTWANYDPAKLTLSGVTSGTNAGTYTATFTPTAAYQWSDGTITAKNVSWSIGRATVTIVPSQSGTLTYTGNVQYPVWSNYDSTKTPVGGTSSSTNAGTFNATFTPTINYKWSDGTTTAKTVAWTMAKAAGSLTINPTSLTLDASNLSRTIAVTRAGDGTITAQSSNTGVATVSVSGTTVTVSHVNQATGTATVTVNVAAGTNHNAPTSKTCAVTAQFLPEKKALNLMTWADINAVCQADKAAEYWSRGDTKSIYLSQGETITVRIEAFAHDDLTDGGKAKMTLGMVDCFNTLRQMNTAQHNVGGWGNSSMRTSQMGYVLGWFPSDLQSVIKSVTKYTSAGNASSSITTTEDKVWLFSYTEVGVSANATYSPGGEGKQYPLFNSNTSRIKKVLESANRWWLRSPMSSTTTSYCVVDPNGAITGTTANTTRALAVGFCI